jgi:hypothetical protein
METVKEDQEIKNGGMEGRKGRGQSALIVSNYTVHEIPLHVFGVLNSWITFQYFKCHIYTNRSVSFKPKAAVSSARIANNIHDSIPELLRLIPMNLRKHQHTKTSTRNPPMAMLTK